MRFLLQVQEDTRAKCVVTDRCLEPLLQLAFCWNMCEAWWRTRCRIPPKTIQTVICCMDFLFSSRFSSPVLYHSQRPVVCWGLGLPIRLKFHDTSGSTYPGQTPHFQHRSLVAPHQHHPPATRETHGAPSGKAEKWWMVDPVLDSWFVRFPWAKILGAGWQGQVGSLPSWQAAAHRPPRPLAATLQVPMFVWFVWYPLPWIPLLCSIKDKLTRRIWLRIHWIIQYLIFM